MASEISGIAETLLATAKAAGADAADVLVTDGVSVSIDVLKGKLEHAERAEGIDIGLRVIVGHRQANVSASDASADTLSTMAERAVAMAREAPEDPTVGLANPDDLAQNTDATALDLFDASEEPNPGELQDAAAEAEAAALAIDGISQVSAATAGYSNRSIHLAASNGFSAGYRRTGHALSCVAITGEGTEMERDYYGDMRIHAADRMSAQDIGRIAGERTMERAGARKPPTGAFPVIYDERVSSSLVGHLLQAVNGTAIARGASWLRDALGEQVLPKGLSIKEDPHRPRIPGSRPFDAEGLATKSRYIVEDGHLTGWTLDLGTARKLGLTSTASAARGTSGPPSPSVSNIAMTQGNQSLDDLIRDMGTGLLITSMIGSSINPTTGDYSRGASGIWIENGERAYPVNECTVAGSLRDMLATMVPADDARLHLSRVVPSVLVEGLTVAGA